MIKIYTINEVAEIVGCSRSMVYNYCRKGKIKTKNKTLGHHKVVRTISPSELDKFKETFDSMGAIPEGCYDTGKAAELLGYEKGVVSKYCKLGIIKAGLTGRSRQGNLMYIIPKSEVERLAAEKGINTALEG